jgi:hypothetical protein
VFATLDFYCVFICNCRKKGEGRGYKSVTLETMMNTKADKAEKKITHHVTPQANDIYKETNRFEPRETLKEITVKVQEPPKPTL